MQPNSSEIMTGGGTGATHTVGGKEFPVQMVADSEGHLVGSRPDYLANFPAGNNAVNREVAELFNGSADKIIRVRGIWLIPTQTAITGAQQAFDINKITSAGTTGLSAVTPRPMDSSLLAANLTSITVGHSSTAGGALGHLWFPIFLFNEETSAPVGLVAYQNQLPMLGDRVCEIVLRQNEGVQIKQTVGAVGATGALILFTVDN